ncbi:MAG TPA: hypothetical protein VFG30_45200 [Polyangiales bacterium]|nr:hypothetical protein [Polyangiales bacterium]
MKRAFAIACVLFGIFGCGDDGKAPFVPRTRKDSGPDDTKRDAAVEDGGMTEGPLLKFTMPEAAKNPKDDTVVTSALVAVRCEAKKRSGKAPVSEATVAITLDKVDEETAKEETQPPTTKVGENEYEAKFDVTARPNGLLRFRCAAKDTATTPHASLLSMDTLLDLGPKIEIEEPKDESIHALHSPVTVKFQVTSQPLADGDEESAVKNVKLSISGTEYKVTEAEDKPGLYQTSVDFSDKALFMVPPSTAEVVIIAANGRTPTAASRSVKSDIKIDGDGPSIKVETPMSGSIVHGEVLLKVTVTDVSGIKPGSLNASINDTLLKFSDWDQKGDSYEHTFDTRAFGLQLTQITINVAATDVVGNQTDPPASFTLRLDNLPPLVSLDPPPLREFRKDGTNRYCSKLFDPVGTTAQSDLSSAVRTSYYRAIVLDQTNHDPGSQADYYAGVDATKVVLYAQPDPSIPLLIDTNNDGECDDINFAALPENKRPTIIKLTALEPRGTAFYPTALDDYGGSFCTGTPSSNNMLPSRICTLTEMFRVVAAPSEGRGPAIYGYMPTNSDMGECEGQGWSVQPIVGEGWRCLAARTEDTIGNVGISAPLRVCFNDPDDGKPAPDCSPGLAPACTGSCTISNAQLYSAGMIWEAK